MKLCRLLVIGFGLLGFTLVLTNCKHTEITVQAPIILAEGYTQLANGKNVAVYLEMRKGRYFQAAAGESPYISNFQGTYQFRVTEEANPSNTLCTEVVSFDEGTELNFNQTFPLKIQDYNGDGNPDFTLGQKSIGSTNMLYQLYSLDSNGKIYDLPFSDGHKAFMALADTNKATSFSIELETRDGELIITYYDTELSKLKEISYRWENNSFINASTSTHNPGSYKTS